MKEYTKEEILAHRRKWIDYLKEPTTQKHVGSLESPTNSDSRCCLGHACHVLIPDGRDSSSRNGLVYYDNQTSYAPLGVQIMLGLWSPAGSLFMNDTINFHGHQLVSLAGMNDTTNLTSQQIGEYLETVIEGGPATPFRPLSDYE